MLALAAAGHDKQAAASQTWAELVEFAGRTMPHAAPITRDSLPETARNRHAPIADAILTALNRLRSHSQTVLDGIRTTLADVVELRREKPIADVLERLEGCRSVLVTGPAGFGKSAIAKRAVEQLAADNIVLAFRSEELAASHLDQSLHQAQIGTGSEELFAAMAGQGRKVILVESVERLLESSQREAFLDLLRLVANDPSWRLVLTCRDYSTETVRAAFIKQAELPYAISEVPELTTEELAEAVAAIPALRVPASHPFLEKLFRNPYYLDKAASMAWPPGTDFPASERAFRQKFWREVVRHEQHADRGMPKRREQAFIALGVRRAQALQPFVPCEGLDTEAIDKLHTDGLVIFKEQTDMLVAPSHDALEDWVVLQWIEEAHALSNSSRADLAAKLGSYPVDLRVPVLAFMLPRRYHPRPCGTT